MKTIYQGGEGEIVEKKSRFIATVRPAQSEEEAVAFIAEMKKKYWDARHNCSAFVIGSRQELTRCSDDGEPAQTAGRPMLDVLLKEDIHNAAVVVTRYFGGTLLGTGGLVRAYQKAVAAGLSGSVVIDKLPGKKFSIRTDYNGLGKIQHILAQSGIPVLDTEYAQDATLSVIVPLAQEKSLCKDLTESTGGKAVLSRSEDVMFANIDGKATVFES